MVIDRNENNEIKNDVKIGNKVIEKVTKIKYLGIILDSKLSFEEQTLICAKKAASKVNFLSRISNKLTVDTKKLVYNSIILPQFDYCSTIYFTCNKEQIGMLQKIQNRALRIILNCVYLTSRELMLKTIHFMSIAQRIKFNVLVMIYKMINELLPIYLCQNLIFTRDVHIRNTRQNNANVLRLPNYNIEYTRKNVFLRRNKII